VLKAIIFDFDGVLVESVGIKGDAFVALYERESPEIRKQVLDYHNRNGGVSRFDKIRYFEKDLLERPASDAQVRIRAQEFGDIVERKVVECPWVAGAQEFLKFWHDRLPLFVASATPQEELERIVRDRGANHYFREVLGTPVTKREHIANIMNSNGWKAGDLVMVGDAITDYDAAKVNDISFVGRVACGGISPFPEGTRTIEDLRSLVACVILP
jgi:phosphoglycolate phosphatase-like HAD superfamily hydrolase